MKTPPQILPGHSFGLGFAVRTQQGMAPFAGSVGQFYWGGIAGTFFFIDPKDDMFTIVMMESPSQRGRIQTEIKTLIYQALAR